MPTVEKPIGYIDQLEELYHSPAYDKQRANSASSIPQPTRKRAGHFSPHADEHLDQRIVSERQIIPSTGTFLDTVRKATNFVAYNKQQQKQAELVFYRQVAGSIVNNPVNKRMNRILRPDIETGGFDAATYKMFEDMITSYVGQLARSALRFNLEKKYELTQFVSFALEGFAMTAETHDDSQSLLSEEIKAGRKQPIYNLINNSEKTAEMLDKFVHGKLEISPDNLSNLQGHFKALAQLCMEKSVYKSMELEETSSAGADMKASGYIRDVMRLDKITTPRQAQIMSGFLASVMLHSAEPMHTEGYVPEKEIFLPQKELVKLSEFVAQQMQHRGFVKNVSVSGAIDRPFPGLPEGTLIKDVGLKDGHLIDYQEISKEEMLAFANAVQGYIRENLANKLENMLEFVDRHFDKVEDAISRSREAPIKPVTVWPEYSEYSAERNRSETLTQRVKEVWKGRSSLNPLDLIKHINRVINVAFDHIGRPESVFEMTKLSLRSIAASVISFPVKIIDDTSKSTLEVGKGFSILLKRLKNKQPGPGEPDVSEGGIYGPSKIKDPETGEERALYPIIDKSRFENNIKSKIVGLATSPLIASVGTVIPLELFNIRKGMAIEAAGRADSILKGAIKSGHHHMPQVRERLSTLQNGSHPALNAIYQDNKEALAKIREKKPENYSEQDLQFLIKYYEDIALVSVSIAEEALSPYGFKAAPDKIDSIDQVVARVLRKPVENAADAMIALAYAESFIVNNAEYNKSMDYVDPTKILIKHSDLRKLSNFIDKQAAGAGLKMVKGDEEKGIEKNSLLERNVKTGEWEPISEETLVRFANVVTEELKHYVNTDNLLYALYGKHNKTYTSKIEKSLFGDMLFGMGNVTPQADTDNNNAVAETGISHDLTQPWEMKIKRPKSSRVQNIRESLRDPQAIYEWMKLKFRAVGLAVATFFPSLGQNALLHNEKIFSAAGIYSTSFKAAVYPVIYGKGIVIGKEVLSEMLLRRRHIINEADVTKELINGALATAGELDPDLKQKLIDNNHIHADIVGIQKKDELKDAARVTGIPRGMRTMSDHKLAKRLGKEIGDKVLENSVRIMGALGYGETVEAISESIERVVQNPVDNLKDAVVALGFIRSLVNSGQQTLSSQAFIDPKDIILDRKQTQALSEYANNQAANAVFALHGVPIKGKHGSDFWLIGHSENGKSLKDGEMIKWNQDERHFERADAESIIRYANVLTAKYRELTNHKTKKEENYSGKLAERFSRQTIEEVVARI